MMEEPVLWAAALFGALALLLVFRRAAKGLIRVTVRTALGAVFLSLTAPLGGWLGVNLFNALVLGVLGLPGLGLLLLLRWSCL